MSELRGTLTAYIPTMAHMPRVRAHLMAQKYELPYVFVCDDYEQVKRLRENTGAKSGQIIMTPPPPDVGPCKISWKRDWLVKNFIPEGSTFIWIDDNVERLTHLAHPAYWSTFYGGGKLDFELDWVRGQRDWRKLFETEVSPSFFHKTFVPEMLDAMEREGTIYAGLATETNYFYRRLKWQLYGYVRTQFAFYKNDASTWYPFRSCMQEDMYKSIDVVARYGAVVINRFVKPIKPFFEEGGIGSFESRLPHLLENTDRFCSMYPGLVKPQSNNKPYQAQFKLRTRDAVYRWRRENDYV